MGGLLAKAARPEMLPEGRPGRSFRSPDGSREGRACAERVQRKLHFVSRGALLRCHDSSSIVSVGAGAEINTCPGWGFSRIDVSEATREIIAMRTYDDPRYWRERADEARTTASHVCNCDIRAAMVRIAVEYDQIASLIERPLNTASEPNMPQRMASTR